ncbi:MAG: tyrosine-type recombinase/integrase [Candidatus ainarchaeum sp.]|nr:tyrosine-type recombinase/integrase [Candidatus ainarchaeum sp.]
MKKDFEAATVEDFQRFVGLLKEQKKSPSTLDTYKEVLKVFYKWLNKGKGYPACVAWFKSTNKHSHKLPESLLSQEDVKEMEKNALNLRDKALISVLWESGARIGEIGTLQLKNIVFDEFGCKILVDGKTGMRRVRLVNSAPNLLEWINQHPERGNPNAFAFVNIEKTFAGRMHHRNMVAVLKKSGTRAKIQKPVNPHHFRHSRATYMAQFLTEAQLKEYFGWVQESKMAAQYVHLSGKQVDDAILRMHGLKEPDKKVRHFETF